MTPEETAEMLSMKRQTLMRRAKLRLIPSFHNGRAVRFDPAALSRWLVEQGAPKFHRVPPAAAKGKRKLITHERASKRSIK
jgi:Helix-turn-helix domain